MTLNQKIMKKLSDFFFYFQEAEKSFYTSVAHKYIIW